MMNEIMKEGEKEGMKKRNEKIKKEEKKGGNAKKLSDTAH